MPPRRSGMVFAHASLTSSLSAPVISVMMKPGAIQLARMPREPSSLAVDLASPIMPALDAE